MSREISAIYGELSGYFMTQREYEDTAEFFHPCKRLQCSVVRTQMTCCLAADAIGRMCGLIVAYRNAPPLIANHTVDLMLARDPRYFDMLEAGAG